MGSNACYKVARWLDRPSPDPYSNFTKENRPYVESLYELCDYVRLLERDLATEVITVAMKLPVDLSSPMRGTMDQVAKIGSLAFMCVIMSNLMPSLASMDNKSLLVNVTGLSILVITLTTNIFIQVRTHLLYPDKFYVLFMPCSMILLAYTYMCMLVFLLLILISSSITILSSKKVLELKYKVTLNDKYTQENHIHTLEELRELVKRYWIMAETSNPQFVMSSNPLSSASGVICAFSMVVYISLARDFFITYNERTYESIYKWSMIVIVIAQSIGIVVGGIAPILRCFTVLTFKSFANQYKKHFLVFNVEKYWTHILCEWKESGIGFSSSGRRSRALLYDLKTRFLIFCTGFQKTIVVSCKIIGLLPIAVIVLWTCCSMYYKSLKATLFMPPTSSSSDDKEENDLSGYVLLLEDNMALAETTIKRISNSMNHLFQNAQKKQHNNLLKLVENSVAFNGVETFDTDQIQSLLSVEPVNSWSLPIISLTCIAISLPNVCKHKAENLLKSVGGLFYTYVVEESLNKASDYAKIRRATLAVWHEVEYKCKWLETPLQVSAYEGKTSIEVINMFAHKAKEIVAEFNRSINGEVVEKKSLPSKVIIANSMYRIAKTIMHTYEINNLDIIDDELFTRLFDMIADILAACLTNIPRVITKRCYESAIEKREASVAGAIDLLGRTSEIIKRLETRDLPNINLDKMEFIDEWRLHFKQP